MLCCSHTCRGKMRVVDSVKSFWAKVIKGDGCWEWVGGVTSAGYGSFCADGEFINAHRFSWKLHFGPIPDGKHVLHKCDNRRCVRPVHLFLGTNDDNIRDRISKGRPGGRRAKFA